MSGGSSSSSNIEATFVVVGGGIAGVSCAENLAFLCPSEKILLITESSLIKTISNLVPLAKSLTKFDVEERGIDSINKSVTVIVDTLLSINSKNKEIYTKNQKLIKYEYLCLCTGARPKLIESDNEYVIGIRDTETVLEFQKRIKNSRKLILVGNGGIASEIAYEVKGIEIDWIVKDSYISSTFVDPGAAQFFQNRLKSKDETKSDESTSKPSIKRLQYDDGYSVMNKRGAALGPDWHRKINISGNLKNLSESVHIHYNCEIKDIKIENSNELINNKHPLKVILTNDEVIYCDFVVSATGVIPQMNYTTDVEFKRGPDNGIFVNEFMETNIPNIYAAGDVCYAGWEHSRNWFQMRLWTQARQMGGMAGRSMAAKFNKEEIYQDFCFELFGHVTTLFGYQVVLLGRYNGQELGRDYEALLRVTKDKEYIKFVIQNGKLRGAILIGETGLEETCENLILNEIDITPYGDDILNPDIDIEDYFD